MRTRRRAASDYDTAWKEILERYLPLFLLFFFPVIHGDIDWSRSYEFLDKELQQARPRGRKGRRTVDKLVKVWLKSGAEVWVLIHIEIQNREQEEFPERMYEYSYRLFDRYGRPVASLAVLGDSNPEWRPTGFGYDLWETGIQHRFRIVKLTDFEAQWEMLEQSTNPFAYVVMAHLRAIATQRKPQTRLQWKLILAKSLYERGLPEEEVVDLLRFLDWVMALSPRMERRFDREMEEYEEQKKMPRLAPFEQRAMERGREQGMLQKARELVLVALEAHFGEVPPSIRHAVNQIEDDARLDSLVAEAVKSASLDEFLRGLGA